MVNDVSEQGHYWIANNFIWGWLLVPIFALGEIIKKDCKDGYDLSRTKTYTKITFIIIGFWLVTMPVWPYIFKHLMGMDNSDYIFGIVSKLVPFYMAYAFSAMITNIFYGLGKTHFLLIISICVNIGYYGIIHFIYQQGFITPTINFIILMFGFGMVVNLVIAYLLKHFILDN